VIGKIRRGCKVALRPAHAVAPSVTTAVCLAACFFALTQIAAASGKSPSIRCATFRAKGAEYGVYVDKGQVKCGLARGILKAIANGKGRYVNNGFSYNSYTLYAGWLCPSGNMGEQTCEHSKHPVGNPSQDITSLLCSVESGCPKQAGFQRVALATPSQRARSTSRGVPVGLVPALQRPRRGPLVDTAGPGARLRRRPERG